MAVTLTDIKKLRDITGAGMMDVKKALEEANGDFEEAKNLLRKRGQAIAAKRSDREASEGRMRACKSRKRVWLYRCRKMRNRFRGQKC